MFERMKKGLARGRGARGGAHRRPEGAGTAGIRHLRIAGSTSSNGGRLPCGSAAEVENLSPISSKPTFTGNRVTTIRDAMVRKAGFPPSAWKLAEEVLPPGQDRIPAPPHHSTLFPAGHEHFIPNVRSKPCLCPFRARWNGHQSGRRWSFPRAHPAAVTPARPIPGVFRPVPERHDHRGRRRLTRADRSPGLGADLVLAVDVDKPLEHDKVEFSSGIDVFFRIEDVQGAYLKSLELRDADLVLHPNVGQLHWSNFERLPELVRLGSDEVEKHLEEIRFLAGRRRWPWLRRGSSAPDGEWVEV